MQNHLLPRAWIRNNHRHSNYLGLHFFSFFSFHAEESSGKKWGEDTRKTREMVDERRMRETERSGWRRMARKKKTLGEGESKRVDREIGPLSAVSRVSVITVLVFSGVNSCIWPWHLPDPPPPCCFSTLLATALADDAIFQFGNNACQAASFCPRFFLFPLCAQPAVSQDKHVPDTMFGSVFRAWNLFERVIFTPFFFVEYLFLRTNKRSCWKIHVNPSGMFLPFQVLNVVEISEKSIRFRHW